jgi:pseudouridine synthase
MDTKIIRLQKYIAECGVCSRRKAEELILAGKVKVNGKLANLGDKVHIYKDKIEVSGKLIRRAKEKRYIMLHKPRGFVTTLSDEFDRKCITMLTEDIEERVYPVGRLDMYSEGLLLMTDDGELTCRMTHPSHGLTKTYIAEIPACLTEDDAVRISEPFEIDGYMIKRPEVTLIESGESLSKVKIVLAEGRNRQIRRMCEHAGFKITKLRRISIGELTDDNLPLGKYRFLTEEEINYLKSI